MVHHLSLIPPHVGRASARDVGLRARLDRETQPCNYPEHARKLGVFIILTVCLFVKVTDTVRHKDVFANFFVPQMLSPRAAWDNLSETEEGVLVSSIDGCRARCVGRPGCRQYSFDQQGVCRTNAELRLGRAAGLEEGVTSGWVEERIWEFQRGMGECGNGSWPF